MPAGTSVREAGRNSKTQQLYFKLKRNILIERCHTLNVILTRGSYGAEYAF